MAKIGVDLDGVLYNFAAAFRTYLIARHGFRREHCPSPQRWEFYEDWGISLPQFLSLCDKAADAQELWRCGGVWGDRNEVTGALRRLQNEGHTLHIITHREFGSSKAVSAMETAAWLLNHDIPYDTLTFSRDKTIVPTDWMIEDNVDNYLSLRASGCRAVLIDRPWNRYLEDAERVTNLTEFAQKIMGAGE